MIHDPRFVNIENMMVQERKAIFGGDARVGKQYFSDDGAMNSSVSDLEKYAELLGEGRNFHNVLVHPDSKCQKRMWLERIYTGLHQHQALLRLWLHLRDSSSNRSLDVLECSSGRRLETHQAGMSEPRRNSER